jgi:NADP-dependent 3-hydroxy acid dehydrogenase YdfG
MNYTLSHRYPRKRAFITGAASGLGKALATHLARDGWTLGLADVNLENLQRIVVEIREAGGIPHLHHFDVADYTSFRDQAETFLNAHDGIDLLFNNAGVGDGGLFEEYSIENYEWMVRVNQMSVIYGCHIFIPAFKKQRSGHILNTASIAAVTCAPTMGAYNLTKAAVVAISETLYGELYDYNVQVSCIMPSYFKTNIAQASRGGELVRKSTQYLLDKSNLEASVVADEILIRAAKNELYLFLPSKARNMALMRRLAPMYFRKHVKDSFLDAMRKISKKLKGNTKT